MTVNRNSGMVAPWRRACSYHLLAWGAGLQSILVSPECDLNQICSNIIYIVRWNLS